MLSRTLFEIGEEYAGLEALLNEETPDTEAISLWLEQLDQDRDEKLDNYAAFIGELEARSSVRKAEAQRMTKLSQTDANKAGYLRGALKLFFEKRNLSKVDTKRYRLSLTKNGGKLPLIVDDLTLLPARFQKVEISADNSAIREALDAGESLEFARLGERGSNIQIK